MCWETICYLEGSTRIILDNDIFINHKSELSIVKPYWYDEPWYLTEDSDEARVVKKRIEQLTDDFGKEPIGMARAMNPDCDFIVRNIMDKKPPYINFYY
jgi:hypothetical protein